MDKQQATNLIKDIFETAFDEGQYLRFLRELFNGQIDESDERKFDYYGQYIPDSFKEHVRRYKRLGIYTDPNGHEIDLLVVILKRDTSLDRARTMQRNFAAYHLKNRDKETAIIAYTTEERGDWRFSMVRREPVVAFSEKGNLIAKDELTPVRRYSFLVGQNERSHTAQQQLLPILVDDKHDPTLGRLENAFNIETVTKEFFERYKGLFLQLKEELDRLIAQNPHIQTEFSQKGLETANFAKKLLGQIVFLYFLQKKGWLGVRQGDNWGAGPKNFLRELFDRKVVPYDNFFNNVLEPLFYEALAIERPDNVYDPLNVKIPFLNGGLFEPVGNYDWNNIDMLIDNGVFRSIFDTFDLYNFTVREDEPLEKEVAVDPEMLGKVFENLLEVTDRKSKGAFYTPREIVHYMCQESLINYLTTTMGDMVSRDDLAIFIRLGEFAVQNDIAKQAGTKTYSYQMPESIRTHAKRLDEALANIKICDPAIGSGAFPVGMMQEIIKAREVLTTYIGEDESRTLYNFKRQAIQESIYGVDIDPAAIDIAKLRLWLSLVVDEDDYHHIKPLPNLDYKIVCGNSLLSVKKNLFNLDLFQTLEQLKTAYFNETNPTKKLDQRAEIDAIIAKLTGDHSQFDMQIYFSEVFHSNKGFDVVIGNPPYVRQERITEYKQDFRILFPDVYAGTADLYVYFFAQGLRILREDGVLTFISPNKFLRAGYGENLRKYLSEQTSLEILIDFGDLQVFDATTYPFISVIRKHKPDSDTRPRILEMKHISQVATLHTQIAEAETIPQSALKPRGWQLRDTITLSLMQKLEENTRFEDYIDNDFYRGVTTGLNSAFEIEQPIYDELTELEPKSKNIIKPWLRGRDVDRWTVNWSGTYLIFARRGINIDEYPEVKRHLTKFKELLEPGTKIGRKAGSYVWYEIQDSTAYYQEFERPKIIWAKYGIEPTFAYDDQKFFGGNTVFILPTDDLSLVGVLNSRVIQWYAQNTFNIVRGGYIEWIPANVAKLPIPKMEQHQKDELSRLVREIIKSGKERSEIIQLEREVDRLVYRLYGLNQGEIDEIGLIERDLRIESNLRTTDFFDTLWKISGDAQ